ncbi:MAG TPA: serine protease [Solirubrobacterales bacterium]
MQKITRSISIRPGVRSFVALALASLAIALAAPAQGHARSPSGDGRAEAGSGAKTSIVGGSTASIASYPWLAYIQYQGPVETFSCTGTVVAPRLILTAAHCLLTGTGRVAVASNFTVLTGVADLREASSQHASGVSQALVFPGYQPSRLLNDAGLLVLSAPVSAPALPLATAADAGLLSAGVPVAVAGWGLTDADPPRSPAVLHEAQSVVKSAGYCQRRMRRVISVYSAASQLCIQSPLASAASVCDGDSGGPGIARRTDGTPVLLGVISLKGSIDCDPLSPQVLTRADVVSPWVSTWIAAVESGAPAPEVVVPKVVLPRVTRRDAEFIAWLGLEHDFGNRFTRGQLHSIDCRQINREKVKCAVLWLRGADLYRGAVTIFAALPREGFVYNYRYTIRRFNANCWLRYLHPIQACNPKIFKR